MDISVEKETIKCKRAVVDSNDLIAQIPLNSKINHPSYDNKLITIFIYDRPVPFRRRCSDSTVCEYISIGAFDKHGALGDIKSNAEVFYGELYIKIYKEDQNGQ